MTTRNDSCWKFWPRGIWLLTAGLLGAGACGNNFVPVVQLRLMPVDSTTARAQVSATATDAQGRKTQVSLNYWRGPFDLLEVTLKEGAPRPSSYRVDLYRDQTCVIATGTAAMPLASETIVELPVTMSPVAGCGNYPWLSYSEIQRDMQALTCTQVGCHSRGSPTKLAIDTTPGNEMDNYMLLLNQQLVKKGDAKNSPLIRVPATGQAGSGVAHVKTLTGTKLTNWNTWVDIGAPF
jgi:hypothetical protein